MGVAHRQSRRAKDLRGQERLTILRAFTVRPKNNQTQGPVLPESGQKYQTVRGIVWAEFGSFLGAFTVARNPNYDSRVN